jgi:hypothetical protein
MFHRADIVTFVTSSISKPVVGLNYVGLTVGCKDSQMLMNKILSYWFVLDGASRDDRSTRDKTGVFFRWAIAA